MSRTEHSELTRQLVELPARVRRLYPRGRCLGLEPVAMQLLLGVRLEPGASIRDLSRLLQAPQGTISHALAELRAADLVQVEADPRDARARRVELTAKGQALSSRFIAQSAQLVAERAEPTDPVSPRR